MSSETTDNTVGRLPATGPDHRKARFFRELATAMEFLALYHTLDADAQKELMTTIQSYAAKATPVPNPERK